MNKQTSDPILQVRDLQVSYGAITALRGISFDVHQGQVVTLIGANGAGKSTTLNTISGLVQASSGDILFEGRRINSWRAESIAAAQLVQVPEGRQIIAPMTVEENLEMGAFRRHLEFNGKKITSWRDIVSDPVTFLGSISLGYIQRAQHVRQDINNVFERFPRLRERRTQKAGSLSGGEQQMLAVGRALMMQPKVLMLDEPSMGLAPILVDEVFDIIAEIKQQGVTLLLVEQNARKALQIADYAYVLDRGNIVREGPAQELRDDKEIIAAYLG